MRIVLRAVVLVIAGLVASCSIEVDGGAAEELSLDVWCDAAEATQERYDTMRSLDIASRAAFEPMLEGILQRLQESQEFAPAEVKQDLNVLIEHTQMWVQVMDAADWDPDVLVARTPDTRRAAFQVNLYNLENCGLPTDF